LRNFFPVLSQAQGFTDATLEARGKLGNPDISLTALSNNCRLQIKGLPDLFTAIKIKATAVDNKLNLEYLTAATKEGEVMLSGKGQLRNLKLTDFDLVFKIKNGPAFYPDICTATVNADGNFIRENGEYNITANIEALEGTVEIKESETNNKSDIVYVDDSTVGETAINNEPPPETFSDHLTLDIKIHADGNVWYKQDTSKAEVMGDLRLLKEPKKPIAYLGSINIKQGYYDFLRNRFVITRGDLQFPGTPGFNPLLNIDGEYTEMSEMKIMATVRGDLHNPQIQLTSDPPQKDVEILSFLLFGKSSTNLTPQEQASVETQVLGFIGRSTVLKVRDILGNKLTIDTLDIKKEEKTGDWRVSVGKYLGRKLFVSYTFGFSAEAEDKLRLEYKLGRSWSVESEISQKHSAGADLFWTVDY
jgi:autotransporter translocation and assembly factor TamB